MSTTMVSQSRGWHLFKSIATRPIRMEDAVAEQIRLGYHPMGYGFYDFKSDVSQDGSFIAAWRCSASCE